MSLRPLFHLSLVSILLCVGLSRVAAQTVELKSIHLSVLEGPEKDRFIAAHNAARKTVNVPPVTWSEELSNYARAGLAQQKDQLVEQAKRGWVMNAIVLPEHRKKGKYGENIAGWFGGKNDAERAVASWLREKAAFDRLNVDHPYRVGDEKGKTDTDLKGKERPIIVGHYTAIVWKETTHLGAAKLAFELADDSGSVRTYVAIVCNYDPPGNFEGEKPF